MEAHIHLSKSSFERLFPFFIKLDKDLRILQIGRSMKKVMGSIEGKGFSECFKLLRPKLSIHYSYDSFCSHQNIVVIAEALNTPVRIKFRGELVMLSDQDEIHYLASPWLTETNDLSFHNLLISDFALHDTITDNLQLLRSKEIVNEDLIKIADQLISQRNELVEKNATIEEIARFPDQNPQPILRIGFDGELLYGNSASRILLEKYDLLSMSFWGSMHTRFQENGYKVIEKEISIDDIVLDLTMVPFPEKQYYNVYIRDVSQILLYQQELLTTNARLSTLINSMQSGILAESLDRHIILVNKNFCEIFSIPMEPEQMIGADCSQAAEQSKGLFQDETGFVQRIGEILQKREFVYGEQLFMKDGRVLERDYIPIFEEGKYQGHIWKYQDITEIVNSKESLKKVEEKYRKIIEALDFGMIEVDEHEVVTKVYPAFCKLTGYTPEELLGKNARNILAFDEDNDQLDRQMELRGKGLGSVYEAKIRTKTGEVKWVIISGTPIFNERDQIVGSMGIHIDITDRKILEQELTSAKEKALSSANAKQLFLANVSHELRTPINVLIGMADLLEETNPGAEQLRYIQAMQSASKNLLGLINDVLDFSKIEAGHISLNKIDLDIKELVRENHAAFVALANEKDVELKCQLDEEIDEHFIGDPIRIGQVLSNLIGNALKFTDKGSVVIRTRLLKNELDKQLVRFEVEDTGIGISEVNKEKIFQTFMQEDQSISRRYGGTGLGLAICAAIVGTMNGEIGVESTPGVGSTFYFEIPLEKGGAAPEVRPKKSHLGLELEGYRILVAEDNPLNQLLINSILSKAKVNAELVVNGFEVLELLKNQKFDLILMDVQMPEMDGLTATREVRRLYGNEMPIVALTANASPLDREVYLAEGMNEVLTKPFNKTELLEVLQKLIKVKSVDNEEVSFSLDYLMELSSGDAEFLSSILSTFVENTPRYLDELDSAINTKDLGKIKYNAHQLKPSLQALKISRAYDLACQIEQMASVGNSVDDIMPLIRILDTDVRFVIQRLAQNNKGKGR